MNSEQLKQRILRLDEELEEYKNKAFRYGLRKMFIFKKGFGNDYRNFNFKQFSSCNTCDNVEFTNEGIQVLYEDAYYDLRDTTEINLSYEELATSEEENILSWQAQYETKCKRVEQEKQEAERLRKLKGEEQERKTYEKLKEKYG